MKAPFLFTRSRFGRAPMALALGVLTHACVGEIEPAKIRAGGGDPASATPVRDHGPGAGPPAGASPELVGTAPTGEAATGGGASSPEMALPDSQYDDDQPAPGECARRAPTSLFGPFGDECSDGVDNDGDGLVDWGQDLGCTARNDGSEGGLPTGTIENSFTVHEPSPGTRITFVANDGSDDNPCGAGPARPKRTLPAAVTCLRDGQPDWLFLRAGDSFGRLELGERSGQGPDAPLVVAAWYPESNASSPPPRLTGGLWFRGSNVHILGLDWSEHYFAMAHEPPFQRHILLEGNRQSAGTVSQNIPTLGVYGHRHAVRHHVFWETPDSAIFEGATTGCITYEHNLFYRPSFNTGNHALYGARVAKGPNMVARYNWIFDGRDHGNGLMSRPGGYAHRNVIDAAGWGAVTMGACTDEGWNGRCDVPGDRCGACIPWVEVDDTFHQNCGTGLFTVSVDTRNVLAGNVSGTCEFNCAAGGGGNAPGTTGEVQMDAAQASRLRIEDYFTALGVGGGAWPGALRAHKGWRDTAPEYLADAFFRYMAEHSGCQF